MKNEKARRETFDLETKFSTDDDSGTFTGYASVFGEPDAYGDTIKPGAFKKTLAEHRRAKSRPVMLWSHDPSAVIGRWDSIEEDEKGLKVTGRLVTDITKGAEALALLKAGALNGLSIGFRTRSAERGPNGGRLVTDIELHEISLVAFPAARKARVTSVKQIGRANASAAAFVKACREASRSLTKKVST